MGVTDSQLALVSLSPNNISDFEREVEESRNGERKKHRWPRKGLTGYACLGSADILLLSKSVEATAHLRRLLDIVDLPQGLKGNSQGGWSRSYSCSIDRWLYPGESKYCHPFAFLILLHTSSAKDLGKSLLAWCHGNVHGLYDLFVTDGYYQYGILTEDFSRGLEITCSLRREYGVHTYSVPLVSLDWVAPSEERVLGEAEEIEAEVAIELNCLPGKEVQAKACLRKILTRVAVDGEMVADKNDLFRYANGIKDIGMIRPIKLHLGRLKQELWSMRKDGCGNGIIATRTYVLQNGRSSKTSGHHEEEPVPEKRGVVLERSQPQPLKPFYLEGLAGGFDWSRKLDKAMQLLDDIFRPAYKNTQYSLNGNPTFPEFRFRVVAGERKPLVVPHIQKKVDERENRLILEILLSHATMLRDDWEKVLFHELTVATYYSCIVPNTRLLGGRSKNGDQLSFSRHFHEPLNYIWRTVAEVLATGVGMIRARENLLEYLNTVFGGLTETGNSKASENQQGEEQRFSANFRHRWIGALMLKNRIGKNSEDDAPSLHWLAELEEAKREFDELTQHRYEGLPFHPKDLLMAKLYMAEYSVEEKMVLGRVLAQCWASSCELARNILSILKKTSGPTKTEWKHPGSGFYSSLEKIGWNYEQFFYSLMLKNAKIESVANSLVRRLSDEAAIADNETGLHYLHRFFDCYRRVEQRLEENVQSPRKAAAIPLFGAPQNTSHIRALGQVGVDLIDELAELDNLVRQWGKVAEDPSMSLGSYQPVATLGRFEAPDAEKTGEKGAGGEYTTVFPSTDLSGDASSSNTIVLAMKNTFLKEKDHKQYYGYLLQNYVYHGREWQPVQHHALQMSRKMRLELICLESAISDLETRDVYRGDVRPLLSVNLTPWLFLDQFNPWAAAFGEKNIAKLTHFARLAWGKGYQPVVEIAEGFVPFGRLESETDEKRRRSIEQFWSIPRTICQNLKETHADARLGLAIDDHYGPGTDMYRLKGIADQLASLVNEAELAPFVVKIDHKVLLSLLDVIDLETTQQIEQRAEQFGEREEELLTGLGRLVGHSITRFTVDKIIVYEGLTGPRRDVHLPCFQTTLKKIVAKVLTDPEKVTPGLTGVYLQGA